MIEIITYDGRPFCNAELRVMLGLDSAESTLFVATAAQEGLRAALDPDAQVDGYRCSPPLLFHKALRDLMPVRPLTRAEERVALTRAITALTRADPDLTGPLKHDVLSWRDALAQLAEQGVVLDGPLPSGLAESLVSPGIGGLLARLQSAYRDELAEYGRLPFEDAARDFLDNDYQPTPIVVMEGFTYLTPLQRHLVTVAHQRRARVYLIHPDRAEQSRGFAIMRRTYAPFVPPARTRAFTTPPLTAAALGTLQNCMFGSSVPVAPPHDGTVTLCRYTHRHDEVEDCITQIMALLAEGEKADDIAIVVRDVATFQAPLQEEADLQRLPVTLGLPPRMLLLTPVGRFILTLYEVWRDGDLEMTADQFESILTSGWLGGAMQATADQFNAVRAQLFARCSTFAAWAESLQHLRGLLGRLDPDARMPASSVHRDTVRLWDEAVATVAALCERLFGGGPRAIGAHVARLLDELSRLDPDAIFTAEREVLERIQEALEELAEESSLAMTAEEFGDVLAGMVRDHLRAAEEEAAVETPGRIWVTTPEGLDGYHKEIVFYLGVDDRAAPRAYSEPWPFAGDGIDDHQERERYLFLAVARAARRQVHLSYAVNDGPDRFGPSPYLGQVAALLHLLIQTRTDRAPLAAESGTPSARPPRQARRDRYTIHEIAHFALCPYRYKLERLDPRAGRYRDEFQVRFLAQAEWLDRIFCHLEAEGLTVHSGAELAAVFRMAKSAVRASVQADFHGFRPSEWRTTTRYTLRALEGLVEYIFGHPARPAGTRTHPPLAARYGTRPVSFEPAAPAAFALVDGGRSITVEAGARHAFRFGDFSYVINNDLLGREWLSARARPTSGSGSTVEVEGLSLFATGHDAQQWWSEAIRIAAWHATTRPPGSLGAAGAQEKYERVRGELLPLVHGMQAGNYPKHPGDHCAYCPVRADCLGLEP